MLMLRNNNTINANATQCQGIPMLLQQIPLTAMTNFEKGGGGGGGGCQK